MKTTHTKYIGNLGEALTVKYLKNKGFTVLTRNYRLPYGEIDIVASKSKVIHFIEVKSVTCEISDLNVSREIDRFPNPAERIDVKKLIKIEKAAQTYMTNRGLLDSDWQIDGALVWVDLSSKRAKVELIENVTRE